MKREKKTQGKRKTYIGVAKMKTIKKERRNE